MAAKLFVRCGDRFAPPEGAEVVTLPGSLTPADVSSAVRTVRDAITLIRENEVDLIVAGPGGLCYALGQALEHVPTKVTFVQLNQATKNYEAWVCNTQNL